MKAIILSAGRGSRLGSLVNDCPKCLIDFNGRSLLDRQLDALASNGVAEAVVVTGFHEELVREAIARRSSGPNVRTVFNPLYMVADNLGSVLRAREELVGDCLVWNGDTLVSPELMRKVLSNDRAGICVTINCKDSYDEDDMKVVTADDGRLLGIGKGIFEGMTAESIGLVALRAGGAEQFRDATERAMLTPEGTYLEVIHQLAQVGEVWTLDITGDEWCEVDFPVDVEAAQALTRRWDERANRVAA